jgi:DNA-directed RNA polymerase subunit M/transcription elongation factor TFIIS
MAVWKLKSCPRCNRDIFIQREIDGWYEECLACGYRKDISKLVIINTVGQVKVNELFEIGEKI